MSGPLLLALALIAVYWLARVGRAARLSLRPAQAWWGVPGLALLLLAPLLDLPALFGVGAALLLLSEFAPAAFVPAPAELPGRWAQAGWPLVGVVLGAGLLTALPPAPVAGQGALLPLAASLLLAGAAGLLGALLTPPLHRRAPLGFQVRWNRTVTPEWPDLSVTVTEQGAYLKNVSGRALRLAGWSPAGLNAWYRVRGPGGTPLLELRSGQEALLPVTAQDSGVRVWYAPLRADEAHLFRADWTPPARAESRVLN
ncbi:hypothetical protein [Deinococcus indicus]|uniref:hypothetical protein n=1 Tax=Deinococcus indicus TaxID=223556 RepID=UPI000B4AF9A8|nr:hypothetical protein [Deinococcus indicus]